MISSSSKDTLVVRDMYNNYGNCDEHSPKTFIITVNVPGVERWYHVLSAVQRLAHRLAADTSPALVC
ncbi:hypothetical protein DPMN_189555 [Dreissena polymorpha]|uniref:Uncharacterized protein n=1 Tax=Dreissena polymorpha TaxID=45954 RepID=A0A9D4ICB1_DREPO|nr:hypothetical protein DPMN_189555 [Dreissena polymorpha]